jgi:predicted CXXCH cytochrome family protein
LKNEMHADLGDMACIDCHNPHGGEDHLILY